MKRQQGTGNEASNGKVERPVGHRTERRQSRQREAFQALSTLRRALRIRTRLGSPLNSAQATSIGPGPANLLPDIAAVLSDKSLHESRLLCPPFHSWLSHRRLTSGMQFASRPPFSVESRSCHVSPTGSDPGESPRTPEPSPPSPETAPRSRVAHILKPAGAAAPGQPSIEDDGLLAFDPHLKAGDRAVKPKAEPQPQPTPSGRGRFWLAITAAIVTTAAVTFGLTATQRAASWLSLLQSRRTAPPLARLTITTRPDGAQVSIDGEARGVTPLTLSVNPGPHTLAVRTGGQERVVPITAAAGADIVRDFEMTAITPPVTECCRSLHPSPECCRSPPSRPAHRSPSTENHPARRR